MRAVISIVMMIVVMVIVAVTGINNHTGGVVVSVVSVGVRIAVHARAVAFDDLRAARFHGRIIRCVRNDLDRRAWLRGRSCGSGAGASLVHRVAVSLVV